MNKRALVDKSASNRQLLRWGSLGRRRLFYSCSVDLRDSHFAENEADVRGGGIYIGGDGTFLFDHCSISDCSAPIGAHVYFAELQDWSEVRFNCCDIDTTEFEGPTWDAGLVEITYEDCTVPYATKSWSEFKGLYR